MTLAVVNQGQPVRDAGLLRAARDLPPGAPVIIMLHGYRFAPGQGANCPHRHILALDPDARARRAPSWPRGLGFTACDAAEEGLAVAYGWPARGGLRAAYARAGAAGAGLADLIAALADAAGRPVSIIGHSLGARMALAALGRVGAGEVGRAVLLAAADFRASAAVALDSPGGARAEVVNILSRQNAVFDRGLEWLLSGGEALGRGMGAVIPNWLDLCIDSPGPRAGLARLGHAIAPPGRGICHWAGYLRPGVFGLYRAALREPARLPLGLLRAALQANAQGAATADAGLMAV